MGRYEAYPRASDGSVVARPMTFEATNDSVAIAQAMQWADGGELELWHEGKRVGVVERRMLEDGGGAPASVNIRPAISVIG